MINIKQWSPAQEKTTRSRASIRIAGLRAVLRRAHEAQQAILNLASSLSCYSIVKVEGYAVRRFGLETVVFMYTTDQRGRQE